MTMSEFPAFAEMERSGWSDATRASGYVQLFASAPDQAIESLLDAAGADRGLKALDLCCGQGNVSEAMLSRGCQVVGVDFSPAMLAWQCHGTRLRSHCSHPQARSTSAQLQWAIPVPLKQWPW